MPSFYLLLLIRHKKSILLILLLFISSSAVPQNAGKEMSIIAYNIQMLPLVVKKHQKDRVKFIAPKMVNHEIVVFSEVFDTKMRADLIISMKKDFPHHTTAKTSCICQNSGVIIFSKYEIIEEDEKPYYKTPCRSILSYLWPFGCRYACCKADCLSQKGVVYAKIKKHDDTIHVFGSHAQASYKIKRDYRSVRERQFTMLNGFINQKGISKSQPIIIAGDLNVNMLHDHQEFANMMVTLNAVRPSRQIGPNYTFNPETNCLADEGPVEYLDYILFRKGHKLPLSSTIETQLIKCEKPYRKKGKFCDELSDHYPVVCRLSFY